MRLAATALALLLASLALPAAGANAKAPAKDAMVCTYEATTGSRLKRRVCMTPSERKERQVADQQRANELKTREFKTNVGN